MSDKRYRKDDGGSLPAAGPARAPGRATATAARYPVARKANDANHVAADAESAVAQAASASSGAPLSDDVRGTFESSLGADLSAVRVHTGAESAAAASALSAKAYAVGNDIHFADGNYAPADPFGLHLLAHEVAHTQQQSGGAPKRQNKLEVSSPGDAAEMEADRAADAMVARSSFSLSGDGQRVVRSLESPGPGGGESGKGAVSGTAPPEVPKWYQLRSTNEEHNSSKATIYFGTDDDGFTPDDLATIENFVKDYGDLLQSGEYELEVRGYADQRADADYNLNLSGRRASRVFDELGKRLPGGMPDDSTYNSIGEIPSSNNPDDLARNRRVEIHLRKHEGPPPVPMPNLDPPKPDPGYELPPDWSTDWSLTVNSDYGGGEIWAVEGASLTVKNLKNGEEQSFIYAGVGAAASLAPVSATGKSGPVVFHTSKPVSIHMFAADANAHVQIGANVDDSSAAPVKLALHAAGIDLPNGVSGEVWILGGPAQALLADYVVVPMGGLGTGTPNVGVQGTIGPTH